MIEDTPLRRELDLDVGRELVSLARHTIERTAAVDRRPDLPPENTRGDMVAVPGGAFVTIEEGERLRGCRGRVDSEDPLWQVVRESAVGAAKDDPRYRSVEPAEVSDLTVTVTVLSDPAPLDVSAPGQYPKEVAVGRHGLIASDGRHRGLLLLPHVAMERDWGPRVFLTATCQKAGLPGKAWRQTAVDIAYFTARSFEERRPGGDVVDRRFDVRTDGGRPPAGREREPAVAGEFYAGTAGKLRDQIASCFRHDLGPGPLGETETALSGSVTAVVSPHAGYPFSGPIAARGVAALAQSDRPETVVICGPNHRGPGADAAVAPHDRWRTPLGRVPVDSALASALVEDSSIATFDDRSHAGEHSIEVQIPFLQYALDAVSVLPVCLSRLGGDRSEQLGRDLAAAIRRSDRDTTILCSTDLTHYEPHDTAVAADEPVVDAIAGFETDHITEAVEGGHTMCGPWSTVAGLTAARELGTRRCDQVAYATSGQTHGQKDRVVGYCSAVFS